MQFRALCGALGIADVAKDARYADNALRVRHRSELHDTIEAATVRSTTPEMLDRLQNAGVPCAPILAIDQVLALEQVKASGMILNDNGDAGTRGRGDTAKQTGHASSPMVGLPIEWNGERSAVRHAPPRLGEHTAEILSELGIEQQPDSATP
jgi:crotonobetainyl-CoA:carnitine CoA-transferase CaiB-like acyl-CoA transferase